MSTDVSPTRDFAHEERVADTWEGWIDIKRAPTHAWLKERTVHRIDVVAKMWFSERDEFEYRRYTEVYAKYCDGGSGKWRWVGVEDGWRPVAYREIPPIPGKWPAK